MKGGLGDPNRGTRIRIRVITMTLGAGQRARVGINGAHAPARRRIAPVAGQLASSASSNSSSAPVESCAPLSTLSPLLNQLLVSREYLYDSFHCHRPFAGRQRRSLLLSAVALRQHLTGRKYRKRTFTAPHNCKCPF